jgi:hypothetical protein
LGDYDRRMAGRFSSQPVCDDLVVQCLRAGNDPPGHWADQQSDLRHSGYAVPGSLQRFEGRGRQIHTRDLAAELRGTNVLANRLDPGWLKTDMGGPSAEHEVATVLPGALVPALLEDNEPSGRFYSAQDFKYLE